MRARKYPQATSQGYISLTSGYYFPMRKNFLIFCVLLLAFGYSFPFAKKAKPVENTVITEKQPAPVPAYHTLIVAESLFLALDPGEIIADRQVTDNPTEEDDAIVQAVEEISAPQYPLVTIDENNPPQFGKLLVLDTAGIEYQSVVYDAVGTDASRPGVFADNTRVSVYLIPNDKKITMQYSGLAGSDMREFTMNAGRTYQIKLGRVETMREYVVTRNVAPAVAEIIEIDDAGDSTDEWNVAFDDADDEDAFAGLEDEMEEMVVANKIEEDMIVTETHTVMEPVEDVLITDGFFGDMELPVTETSYYTLTITEALYDDTPRHGAGAFGRLTVLDGDTDSKYQTFRLLKETDISRVGGFAANVRKYQYLIPVGGRELRFKYIAGGKNWKNIDCDELYPNPLLNYELDGTIGTFDVTKLVMDNNHSIHIRTGWGSEQVLSKKSEPASFAQAQ